MRSGKFLALTFFARLLCFQFDNDLVRFFLEFLDKQDFYFLRQTYFTAIFLSEVAQNISTACKLPILTSRFYSCAHNIPTFKWRTTTVFI